MALAFSHPPHATRPQDSATGPSNDPPPCPFSLSFTALCLSTFPPQSPLLPFLSPPHMPPYISFTTFISKHSPALVISSIVHSSPYTSTSSFTASPNKHSPSLVIFLIVCCSPCPRTPLPLPHSLLLAFQQFTFLLGVSLHAPAMYRRCSFFLFSEDSATQCWHS